MSHTLSPGLSLARRCTARGTAKLLPRQAAIVSALFHLKMTSRFVMHANPSFMLWNILFQAMPHCKWLAMQQKRCLSWWGNSKAQHPPNGSLQQKWHEQLSKHWTLKPRFHTHKPVDIWIEGIRYCFPIHAKHPITFQLKDFLSHDIFSVLSIPHSFGRWLIRTFEAICTIARSCAT